MKPISLILALLLWIASGELNAGDWSWPAKSLPPLEAPLTTESCLSYDYIDAEYGLLEFASPHLSEGEFYGAGFSKSLGSNLFFTGAFADGTYDYDCTCTIIDVDTRRYRFGLGARKSIAECVDLTFEGGAEHLEAEYGGQSFLDYDSWGYYFGPGIRARAGRFEFFAKALYLVREGDMMQEYLSHHSYVHLGQDESGWLFTPGVIYHLTERLGIKVAAEVGEHDTGFLVGVRYHF